MGGGPEVPAKASPAAKRDLILCTLPWPKDHVGMKEGLDILRKAFDDADIEYHYTGGGGNKSEAVEISDGMYSPLDKTFKAQATKSVERNVPQCTTNITSIIVGNNQDSVGLISQPDILKRTTYLATLSWLPPSASIIPNTHFIQFISAGTNHVAKHPIYTDSKIPLCSANGVHGPQIAEWVIMMDLVHNHRFPLLYNNQKQMHWNQRAGMEIADRVGKKVGILGYGSIGRQVARVAKAMGMDVIAYTASPRKTKESKRDDGYIVPGTGDQEGEFPSEWYSGTSKEEVHHFLKQEIDLLVVAVPLT